MSDGIRDLYGPAPRIPRPTEASEVRVWNNALDCALREIRHILDAGPSASAATLLRTLNARILEREARSNAGTIQCSLRRA